jgi:hypothetical protein
MTLGARRFSSGKSGSGSGQAFDYVWRTIGGDCAPSCVSMTMQTDVFVASHPSRG